MEIIAYKIEDAAPLPLVPAVKKRDWTPVVKGSSLCLPLFIANQWGWWMTNPNEFTVSNRGGDITIDPDQHYVGAHFGFGVMSVLVPYVFKTPEGWNLWMRGPVNHFKDGIHAFEGIVETDWHPGATLMNWYVEDGADVKFEEGEPLAQILPIARNIEDFSPSIQEMTDEVEEGYRAFKERRTGTYALIKATGRPHFEGSYRERTEQQKVQLKEFAGIV